VFEQYDSMVQTNTVQGPGGEAGVMRIKGTGSREEGVGSRKRERGLAMALAGNGRWTYLDPKLGAMHAVAEAARKVACTGATPVAATNCLNFGNPEKPEIMAQLSQAIDGIAEACNALGTPVTGGNVSLYNETKGEGIYPTPVLGVVGIIEDVTKAVPSGFQREGEQIYVISAAPVSTVRERNLELGSSEYAKVRFSKMWGTPPAMHLDSEHSLHKCLRSLCNAGLLSSASDVGDGGLAVAVARAALSKGVGCYVGQQLPPETSPAWVYFSENATQVVISSAKDASNRVTSIVQQHEHIVIEPLGETGGSEVRLLLDSEDWIRLSVDELRSAYSGALEAQIAEELVKA
jgi:phosphoribosylformylglycinamidine synthase